MVDEENSLDDINLDDFNFDDLLKDDNPGDTEVENETLPEEDIKDEAAIFNDADFNLDDVLADANVDGTANINDVNTSDGAIAEENVETENKAPEEENFDIFDSQDIKEQVQDMPETVEQTLSSDVEENVINTELNDSSENSSDVVSESVDNVVDEDAIKKEREQFFENDALDNLDTPEMSSENIVPTENLSEVDENIEVERQEIFTQNNPKIEEDIVSLVLEEENQQMQPLKNGKIGFLKWYSGELNDKFFEIDKNFEPSNFEADEECKNIHVNAGYDTYGWQVQFADGVVMNLRDVREYQIRNGHLPSADGRIIYGQKTLSFSGVERIVVYESVKYFSYGI